MRVMRSHRPGDPLKPDIVPDPVPGPGEALIAVEACGVNFADALMIERRYQYAEDGPVAPGVEAAGRVISLGSGVDRFAVGDRVVAALPSGGMADRAVASAAACAVVPDAVSAQAAAALPATYGTAHLALTQFAEVSAGQRMVVTGAAGGLGLAAVELGARLGAEVSAVARGADRLATCRSMGASETYDAAEDPDALREAFRAAGSFDIVFDTVGDPLWTACFRAVRFGARLFPIGFAGRAVPQIPANHVLVKNVSVFGVDWGAYVRRAPAIAGDTLAGLVAMVADGRLTPRIEDARPLEDANTAIDALRDRSVTGKRLLIP